MKFSNYEPELGPARPNNCADGWESHVWTLTVEEGQLGFTSDCNLCDDGLSRIWDTHEFEVREFTAHLTIQHEAAGDNSYAYVEFTPQPPK